MHYNPLSQFDRFEKAKFLTNRIIVKALQSKRGDNIRAMVHEDLKMMVESVTWAVSNKLAVDAQRAYDCAVDKYELDEDCIVFVQDEKFKLTPDAEIEEVVTAYFEIDGKLQYREVKLEPFIVLPEIDESVECAIQQMDTVVCGMHFDPFSVADRLEEADGLTNNAIMEALLDVEIWDGDAILEMSHAEFKQMLKDIFSNYYHGLYARAVEVFEEECEDYDPERDGFENDPRKKFRPKTEFEIDQEIKAYFEEHGTLH